MTLRAHGTRGNPLPAMANDYANFEVTISPLAEARYHVFARGPGGEANGVLTPPTDDPQFVALAERLARLDTDRALIAQLGGMLFGRLFQGTIEHVLIASRARLEPNQGLRLRLIIDASLDAVMHLPWEFLADQRGPLVLRDTPVVRFLPQAAAVPVLPAEPPLKVLVTGAQTPPPAAIERELRAVAGALASLGDRAQVVVEPHLTIRKLQQLLRQGFHVWHFVGHGGVTSDGAGQLVLEDDEGEPVPFTAMDLSVFLERRGVRLVVLNACEGARLATDPFHSVAPALIRAEVPAVVAMQFSVPEEAAHAFAGEFYRALAEGLPLESCVTEGRRAVMAAAGGIGRADWGIPVIYTRAADGQLFPREVRAPAPAAQPQPAPAAPPQPAAPAADEPINNLPAQPTALIGRDQDAAAAAALLVRPDVRLLTLVGPGGAGKTRLAVHVAESLIGSYPHGVAFVSLASAAGPERVLPAIAASLGVREQAGTPLMDTLKEWLRDRRILLLLDTFDRVLAAGPQVGELLEAAPNLDVIVTSRTVMRLSAEYTLPVQPLPLPDLRRLPPPADLAHSPAVALFVERARAVRPDFALTDANARDVAEICVRLDGLPLAIELGAALSRVLYPPAALLAELSSRLDLLTGGARDRDARQQALRDTIAWSYDTLPPEERALLGRLGVFDGGFTRKAAEEVAGSTQSPSQEVPRLATFPRLASLVDQSLLRPPATGAEPRYSMLGTIREYALEQLADRGEAEAVRARHASFCLRLAAEAEAGLGGPEQGHWLRRLDTEHDNMRTAIAWALTLPAAETALRLCCSLLRYWYTRGLLTEGRGWTGQALAMVERGLPVLAAPDAPPDESRALHARALNGAGNLAWAQGQLDEADRRYAQSLQLRRELGDTAGVAATLNNLGAVAKYRGDEAQAIARYEESLAHFRDLGRRANIADALSNLGWSLVDTGQTTRARAALDESLALRRELGNSAAIATSLKLLGDVEQREGNLEEAVARYDESLALRWELGDQEGIARSLEAMARFAGLHGQPKRAARLWGAAEALRQVIGAPISLAERPTHDQAVSHARNSFEPAEFAQAWAAGAAMPLEQAVADARALRNSRWRRQERATTPHAAARSTPAPPARTLRAADGSLHIDLGRLPLVLGRGKGSDIVIDDSRVSRQHVRITGDTTVTLTDLGSTNGTFVNGERVAEHALKPGDLVSLGGLELLFEVTPAS